MKESLSELIKRRKAWLEEIQTQDNRCTARPIIIALQLAREYPVPEEYGSDGKWEPDEDNGLTEPQSFKIHWEDAQHFFTYSALEQHLKLNRHNYPKNRDFVKYAHRNSEWKGIIEDFITLVDYVEKQNEKDLNSLPELREQVSPNSP